MNENKGKEFLTKIIFKIIKMDKDFRMEKFWVHEHDYYEVLLPMAMILFLSKHLQEKY